MPKIWLSNGGFTKVDSDNYEVFSRHTWRKDRHGYAVRTIETGKPLRMHRVVNNTPDGLVTDHKNSNKLDNRRKNLRSCTNEQNVSWAWRRRKFLIKT